MSQEWLFTTAPYLALAVGLAGVGWRLGTRQAPPALEREQRAAQRLLATSPAWRLSMSVILIGHLVGLALPRQVLLWNLHPIRLLVLEITGMALACVALTGLVASLSAWRMGPLGGEHGPLGGQHGLSELSVSRADIVLVTLLGVLIVSGLGVAILLRWASSWSMSTVVPYVRSLFRLAPEVHAMASLPFLARLHVFAFFGLVVVIPFTSLGVFLTGLRARRRDVVVES